MCPAESLVDETILLSYTKEDKRVHFLGQYNEKCHWDSCCVTNVYNSGGTLFGIFESDLDNGERVSYRSLCVDGDGEDE